MNAITVSNLTKKFKFPVKTESSGFLKNLLHPDMKEVVAVDNISFSIDSGERIAFIGPNGAGKSTTIKMLTGILFPTAGSVSVLGLDPAKKRKELAYQIGTVFGQRSQLLPNLPLTDSFELFGVMYDLTDTQIKKRTQELIELFDLDSIVTQPVRKLSLGQRMRAEVAASLIHKPRIILLDEPTIGLDVVAKKSLRDLLLRINTEEKTTIFLTSHDVGDIESLCERTIIINHGVIMRDMKTADIAKDFIFEKYIDLFPKTQFEEFGSLPKGISYLSQVPEKITVAVNLHELSITEALKKLLTLFEVSDVDVYDTDLETVIRHMYEKDSLRT